MTAKKTVRERESDLQLLLANSAGRQALQELAAQYQVTSGKLRRLNGSVITYILVHERQRGLISE